MEIRKHEEADGFLNQYLSARPTDGEAFVRKAVNDLKRCTTSKIPLPISNLEESIRLAFRYLPKDKMKIFFEKIVKPDWYHVYCFELDIRNFFSPSQEECIHKLKRQYNETRIKRCQFIKENLLYDIAKKEIDGLDLAFDTWMDTIDFNRLELSWDAPDKDLFNIYNTVYILWRHPLIEEQVSHSSPQLLKIPDEKRSAIVVLCNQLKQISSEARTIKDNSESRNKSLVSGFRNSRLDYREKDRRLASIWFPEVEKYRKKFVEILESLLALR